MKPQEKTRYQAEVMLAYANGAEIEQEVGEGNWIDSKVPIWNWGATTYRVKKTPKVVKLEAWISQEGVLQQVTRNYPIPQDWERVTTLDMEYVEDES